MIWTIARSYALKDQERPFSVSGCTVVSYRLHNRDAHGLSVQLWTGAPLFVLSDKMADFVIHDTVFVVLIIGCINNWLH